MSRETISSPASGLRYISDARPGISRKADGKKSFTYFFHGKPFKQPPALSRINALVIPPAWTDVWISPFADSHLQATGRDARGRKQYRYHDEFRKKRDHKKFANIIPFAQALPLIRRRIKRDLHLAGLPREKVLAAIVELLDQTLIRVGNDQYARTNHSFGLSTLKNQHVHRSKTSLLLAFTGKSGVKHAVKIDDRKLVEIVCKCQALPGQRLFEYRDHLGGIHALDSADVNDYIRASSDADFTAKNFRTWWGTVLAALALEKADCTRKSKQLVATVVREVALELRNTPAVCRSYYIHPVLLTSATDGTFLKQMGNARKTISRKRTVGFSGDEAAVLFLLVGLQKDKA